METNKTINTIEPSYKKVIEKIAKDGIREQQEKEDENHL